MGNQRFHILFDLLEIENCVYHIHSDICGLFFEDGIEKGTQGL